jgi:hypothetical protein
VTLLRGRGMPFGELPGGEVSNVVRIKITNRTREPVAYTLSLVKPPDGSRLLAEEFPCTISGGEQRTIGVTVILPRAAFVPGGVYEVTLEVADPSGFKSDQQYRLLGPMNAHRPHHEDDEHHE